MLSLKTCRPQGQAIADHVGCQQDDRAVVQPSSWRSFSPPWLGTPCQRREKFSHRLARWREANKCLDLFELLRSQGLFFARCPQLVRFLAHDLAVLPDPDALALLAKLIGNHRQTQLLRAAW
jgi:hypothetical protein